MQDTRTPALPEGTDTVIAGASETGPTGTGGGNVTVESTADVIEREIIEGGADSSSTAAGTTGETGIADRLRGGRERLSSQAGEKARGLVAQGLERTSEALANVSRMVGDTAAGIEERLGPEYGDYARRAAASIENAANTIAEKDPDELIEDTRNFVRSSPGIALAGAAVVGFVVARLIKSGLGTTDEDEDDAA